MINKNFIKKFNKDFKNGKHYIFTVRGAITTKLIDILPMITIGHQNDPTLYGGIHSFIEFGFLIFHLKISWKSFKFNHQYSNRD